MARCPFAIWRPINSAFLPNKPLVAFNRQNTHITAGGSSPWSFFNQTGRASSHYCVLPDGTIEQYIDSAMQAEGDLEGNDATICVENVGWGSAPLTPAQVVSNARLFAWHRETHGMANKLVENSFSGSLSSKGLGFHRHGIDGNFPDLPSPYAGRIQRGGGMHYSTSRGKVCPGDRVIDQMGEIFNLSQQGWRDAPIPVDNPLPVPPVPTPTPGDPLLREGSRGPAVKRLQQFLGILDDSIFGPVTEQAVIVYQSGVGLLPDGVVGPKTWAKINAGVRPPAAPIPAPPAPGPVVISPGVPAPAFPLPSGYYFGPKTGPKQSVSGYYSYRPQLQQWQQRMRDRGWDITPDGLYGPQTDAVVTAFQREKGLNVDGLIGPQTWAAAWTAPVTRN